MLYVWDVTQILSLLSVAQNLGLLSRCCIGIRQYLVNVSSHSCHRAGYNHFAYACAESGLVRLYEITMVVTKHQEQSSFRVLSIQRLKYIYSQSCQS